MLKNYFARRRTVCLWVAVSRYCYYYHYKYSYGYQHYYDDDDGW